MRRSGQALSHLAALNVSDAAFDAAGDGGPLVEQPFEVYTEMSYTLGRLRFVLMFVCFARRAADNRRYRRIVDHINATRGHDPRANYKVVQEMDSHIRMFLASLPVFFRASSVDTSTDVQETERIMIQLIGQTRLMRLHRPLLARGYRDPAFVRHRAPASLTSQAQSREKCVAAAHEILSLLREDHAVQLLHSWMVVFYCFAAGVVYAALAPSR